MSIRLAILESLRSSSRHRDGIHNIVAAQKLAAAMLKCHRRESICQSEQGTCRLLPKVRRRTGDTIVRNSGKALFVHPSHCSVYVYLLIFKLYKFRIFVLQKLATALINMGHRQYSKVK